MAAEPVQDVEVSWFGVAGDRRWGFVRPGVEGHGFPWLTLRQRNDLNGYRPRFTDAGRPDASGVVVRTPAGVELDVTSGELAAELGDGVRVMKLNRGTFDAMPLSLVSRNTVAGLGALLGREVDPLRFRPNLLIDADGTAPFPEEEWVGRVIAAGGLRMRLDRRDKRCVVVNVDPATGERDPAVLRAVARHRDTRLGVYGTPVTPGAVAVGDPVTLLP